MGAGQPGEIVDSTTRRGAPMGSGVELGPPEGAQLEFLVDRGVASDREPANEQELLKGRNISSIRPGRQTIKAGGKAPRLLRQPSWPYLRQLFLTTAPLVAADLLVLLTSLALCSLLGLQFLNPDDATSLAAVWVPAVAITWLLINAVLELYPGIGIGSVSEFKRLTISLTVVALVTAARIHPASSWALMRYAFMGCAYCICLTLAPLARIYLRRILAHQQWWGFPTLVCGNDSAVFSVYEWLRNNRRLGLRPVGVIADPLESGIDSSADWHVGSWDEARSVAARLETYWAIVVDSGRQDKDPAYLVDEYLGNVPIAYVVSELTGMPDHWNRHRLDEDLNGFMIEQHLLLPLPQLVKRSMDIGIALLVGIVLTPFFALLAVAIKVTSRGPVIYGQQRVGIGNTRFLAWKFRTMIDNAEPLIEEYLQRHPELREEWERTCKLKNDPRVTKLGRFMRKWSIDELPQLWNVLMGEMSVVGPRPIPVGEVPKYGENLETYCSVPPGITGLWQVCGRSDTTYEERIQLDSYYIHHWSPWMDLYLLARTVKTVLLTKGAY